MTTLTIDKEIGFGSFGSIFTPTSYVRSWDSSLIEQYVPHSTSISSSVNTSLHFLMSQGITVENISSVENFLKDSYGIVAHLYDVPEKIRQYFGNVSLNLGVFTEPDSEEDSELYVEVETSLSPEEANQKLSSINREWLFTSEDLDLMSLNITLKFL